MDMLSVTRTLFLRVTVTVNTSSGLPETKNDFSYFWSPLFARSMTICFIAFSFMVYLLLIKLFWPGLGRGALALMKYRIVLRLYFALEEFLHPQIIQGLLGTFLHPHSASWTALWMYALLRSHQSFHPRSKELLAQGCLRLLLLQEKLACRDQFC